MDDRVQEFLSAIHGAHLKSLVYKKQRHTFTRDLEGFTERVKFQGSAWNSRGSSWRFYVSYGVQFRGLPPRSPDRDFPGTHCWARIESIVPEALRDFALVGNDDRLAEELAVYIERASRCVA